MEEKEKSWTDTLDPRVVEAAKWVALVFLPALTTLWLALGPVWGLPAVQEIGATLTAIDAFLGTILGVTAQALAKAQSAATQASSDALTAQVAALRAELEAVKTSMEAASTGDADEKKGQ